jgi:hypothetical protein
MARKQDESLQERNARLTGRYLLGALGVGTLVVLAYGLAGGAKAADGTELGTGKVLGTALAVAGAFFGLGLLLGFIFGVPRSVQEPATAAGNTPPADQDTERNRLKVNTNLEQISDWLTKILVGVGLTQLTAIPGKLQALAEYIAMGLGGGPSDRIFAVGIILYFFICGFFTGYLLTRLYLAGAFLVADNTTQEAMRSADLAQGAVESLRLEMLDRSQAATATPPPPGVAAGMPALDSFLDPQHGLPTWQTLARDYTHVRDTQKPSNERTNAMSRVFNQMCALAKLLEDYDPTEHLRASDDGERLFAYAYLNTRPSAALLTALVDSVTQHEDTYYGQHRGIRAIGQVLSIADAGAARSVLGQLETFAQKCEGHTGCYYELDQIFKKYNGGARQRTS